MSRLFSVIVLCPNGRRETVRVTPNSSILQILEEACGKQSINPEDYDICHYNKPMDPTLPVRFANLPNNALLELRPTKSVRKESLVTVGLQLETGDRIMKEFMPSVSVWEVMEQCLNLRSDLNREEDAGEPVCIYMRQKIAGDNMKSTTLRSLGLTKGAAVIRLLYRKPEELQNQAHVSTPLTQSIVKPEDFSEVQENKMSNSPVHQQAYKQPRLEYDGNSCHTSSVKRPSSEQPYSEERLELTEDKNFTENSMNERSSEPVGSSAHKTKLACSETNANFRGAIDETVEKNDKNFETCNQTMEIDNVVNCDNAFEGVGSINYIGERHAVLYSLEDITDVKKADLPEEFFELTINDVKYLMGEYTKEREKMENQPLLTKEQRQRQIIQKLAHYKQTVIRVYFPEKLVLQAVFSVDETVQEVSNFVGSFLENKDLSFYLYITPPKEKLNPTKTLLETMLVPAAVIYFGCETYLPNYLMQSLQENRCDPRAAALAAYESRKESFSSVPSDTSYLNVEESSNTAGSAIENIPTSVINQPQVVHSDGKIPKWLKLSRK